MHGVVDGTLKRSKTINAKTEQIGTMTFSQAMEMFAPVAVPVAA